MSRKDKFLRQCRSCGKFFPKEELIRITKNYKTGAAEINSDNGIIGRSVYVCKNVKCIKEALKKKKIEHALKVLLPERIKEELNNCTL